MPPGERKTPSLSRAEVLSQLDRLLLAPVIRRSPNSTRLLRFLVERTLDHPSSDISQYTLAFEVLGLGRDFDAERNPLVRMQVARVRRALANHYAGPGLLDPVRFVLPSGSYRLSLERAPTTAARARRPARSSAPLLALVEFRGLGLPGVWSHLPAVLAEELSVCLGQLPGLRILGPLCRRRLEEEGLEPADLSRRHRADFILDGSLEVHPAQNILRVRLLEGRTGAQIWSTRHLLEPGRGDFAKLQLDLINRISLELGADFGPVHSQLSSLARVKPAASLDIHQAVVTARAYFDDFDPVLLRRAITALRKAVRTYPDEPIPKATLSLVLATTVSHPGWTKPIPLAEIDALARAAYALDPSSPWSVQALGSSAMLHGRDAELDALAHRLEADPASPTQLLGSMGLWLVLRRVRPAHGLRLVRAALAANPHHLPILHEALALNALEEGDPKALHRAIDAYGWPQGWINPLLRAAAHALEGDAPAAARCMALVRRADPLFKSHGLGRFQAFAHPEHSRLIAGALAKAKLTLPKPRSLPGMGVA